MEEMMNAVPWAVLAPILVIQLVLILVAIIDLIRIERTNGPKWVWLLVILFLNIIGPILYFVLGRRQNE